MSKFFALLAMVPFITVLTYVFFTNAEARSILVFTVACIFTLYSFVWGFIHLFGLDD